VDLRDLVRVQECVRSATERSADIEGEDELPRGATVRCAGHGEKAVGESAHEGMAIYVCSSGSATLSLWSREKAPRFSLGKRLSKEGRKRMVYPCEHGSPLCQKRFAAP
jgi:hypothetical protein